MAQLDHYDPFSFGESYTSVTPPSDESILPSNVPSLYGDLWTPMYSSSSLSNSDIDELWINSCPNWSNAMNAHIQYGELAPKWSTAEGTQQAETTDGINTLQFYPPTQRYPDQSELIKHENCQKPQRTKRRKQVNLLKPSLPSDAAFSRAKLLERNRLAAQKCRQRRKEEMRRQEALFQYMSTRNHHLLAEVNSLREAVVDLRTRILEHAGCRDKAIDQHIARLGVRITWDVPEGTEDDTMPLSSPLSNHSLQPCTALSDGSQADHVFGEVVTV